MVRAGRTGGPSSQQPAKGPAAGAKPQDSFGNSRQVLETMALVLETGHSFGIGNQFWKFTLVLDMRVSLGNLTQFWTRARVFEMCAGFGFDSQFLKSLPVLETSASF